MTLASVTPGRIFRLQEQETKPPGLRLFSSFAQDAVPTYDMDLSFATPSWRRENRDQGGLWNGNLTITEEDLTLDEMADIFYEKLGFHFEEYSGVKTWEGLIYEMSFTVDGVTRVRSLDMLSNYVKSTYTTPDDGTTREVLTTSAASNSESIARYGRKEELLTLSGYYQAAAEQRRDTHLKWYSWPWARTVGAGIRGEEVENSLNLFIAGYVYTANWRFQSAGSPTQDEVSDWIGLMLIADCPLLVWKEANIVRNTIQVWKDTPSAMTVWDVILDLTQLGDANDDPNRFHVGLERLTYYEPLSNQPLYWLRGGRLYPSAGSQVSIDPWQAQPGVVRDMTYSFGKKEYNSWFQEARDFYMSSVEVGMKVGLLMKSEDVEVSELIAAQVAAQYQIRKGRARKKAKEKAEREAAERAAQEEEDAS